MSADTGLSTTLNDFLDKYAFKVGRCIPLTAANTIWRGFDKKGESILDLGCGRGIIMSVINKDKKFFAVGVDIYAPHLKECKSRGIHDECILCDVQALPFKPKSFDIVFCSQLMEHLEKEHGWRLIREMEEIARRRVIITTPVGVFKSVGSSENPYQEHKSSWLPHELKALGYKVRGSSLPVAIVVTLGFISRLPRSVRRLLVRLVFIPSALADPLVYFLPKLAGNMVCVKSLGKH